jgi:hypothetical protein
MMKTTSLLTLATVAVLFFPIPGLCIDLSGSRYATPQACPSSSSWPPGLAAILADKAYLDGYNYQNPGYVVEYVDTFYYGGDTEALNAFLEKLAKVDGLRMSVMFSSGAGKVNRSVRARSVQPEEFLVPPPEIDGQPCSWLVSVTPQDRLRKMKGATAEADAKVLIFLGAKDINAAKLRLPTWNN